MKTRTLIITLAATTLSACATTAPYDPRFLKPAEMIAVANQYWKDIASHPDSRVKDLKKWFDEDAIRLSFPRRDVVVSRFGTMRLPVFFGPDAGKLAIIFSSEYVNAVLQNTPFDSAKKQLDLEFIYESVRLQLTPGALPPPDTTVCYSIERAWLLESSALWAEWQLAKQLRATDLMKELKEKVTTSESERRGFNSWLVARFEPYANSEKEIKCLKRIIDRENSK